MEKVDRHHDLPPSKFSRCCSYLRMHAEQMPVHQQNATSFCKARMRLANGWLVEHSHIPCSSVIPWPLSSALETAKCTCGVGLEDFDVNGRAKTSTYPFDKLHFPLCTWAPEVRLAKQTAAHVILVGAGMASWSVLVREWFNRSGIAATDQCSRNLLATPLTSFSFKLTHGKFRCQWPCLNQHISIWQSAFSFVHMSTWGASCKTGSCSCDTGGSGRGIIYIYIYIYICICICTYWFSPSYEHSHKLWLRGSQDDPTHLPTEMPEAIAMTTRCSAADRSSFGTHFGSENWDTLLSDQPICERHVLNYGRFEDKGHTVVPSLSLFWKHWHGVGPIYPHFCWSENILLGSMQTASGIDFFDSLESTESTESTSADWFPKLWSSPRSPVVDIPILGHVWLRSCWPTVCGFISQLTGLNGHWVVVQRFDHVLASIFFDD